MAGSAIDHQPKGPESPLERLKGGRHAMAIKAERVPFCGTVGDAVRQLETQPYDVVTARVGRPIVSQVTIHHFKATVCNVCNGRQRLPLFDCKRCSNVNPCS